jgi:hypothetical protein
MYPTGAAAIAAGCPWLHFICTVCRQRNAVDLLLILKWCSPVSRTECDVRSSCGKSRQVHPSMGTVSCLQPFRCEVRVQREARASTGQRGARCVGRIMKPKPSANCSKIILGRATSFACFGRSIPTWSSIRLHTGFGNLEQHLVFRCRLSLRQPCRASCTITRRNRSNGRSPARSQPMICSIHRKANAAEHGPCVAASALWSGSRPETSTKINSSTTTRRV